MSDRIQGRYKEIMTDKTVYATELEEKTKFTIDGTTVVGEVGDVHVEWLNDDRTSTVLEKEVFLEEFNSIETEDSDEYDDTTLTQAQEETTGLIDETPEPKDSFISLNGEIGAMGDFILYNDSYVEDDNTASLEGELGRVLMQVLIFAESQGIDMNTAYNKALDMWDEDDSAGEIDTPDTQDN